MEKALLKATLEDILNELEAGTVKRHDDYRTLFPEEFHAYEWDGEAEEEDDAAQRGSLENVLAVEAIAHKGLHPLMEKVVKAFAETGEKGRNTQIWENEEEQAGGCLARELALYSKQYLPLYLRYIATNDLDHEVFQMDDMMKIFDKWDYSSEIFPLLLYRGEFGQNADAYEDLAEGICKGRKEADAYLKQAVAYFEANWDFEETDDEEDEDLQELARFLLPVFVGPLGLEEEQEAGFIIAFNNAMANGEAPTVESLLENMEE